MPKLTKKDFKLYTEKPFEERVEDFKNNLFEDSKLKKIYLSNSFYFGDYNLIFHFEKIKDGKLSDFLLSISAKTKILFLEKDEKIPISKAIKLTFPKNINEAMSEFYFYFTDYRIGKMNSISYDIISLEIADFMLKYALRQIDMDPIQNDYGVNILFPILALQEILKEISVKPLEIDEIRKEFFKDDVSMNYKIHLLNTSYFGKDILTVACLLKKNIRGEKLLANDDKSLYYEDISYNLIDNKILSINESLVEKVVITESIIELPWISKIVRLKITFGNDEIIKIDEIDNLVLTRREYYLRLNYEEYIAVISFDELKETDFVKEILKNQFWADANISTILYARPIVSPRADMNPQNFENCCQLLRKYSDIKETFEKNDNFTIFDFTKVSLVLRQNEVIIMANDFDIINIAVDAFMDTKVFANFIVTANIHISEPIFFPFVEQLSSPEFAEMDFEKYCNEFGIIFDDDF